MSLNNAELTPEQKIKIVLEGLHTGKTREELAESLGYGNWRGIDSLFRRRGYTWNNGTYVLPEEPEPFEPEQMIPRPVRIVLRQLELGEKDLSLIASKAGFKDRTGLTNYMKSQGWLWQSAEETYVHETHINTRAESLPKDRLNDDKLQHEGKNGCDLQQEAKNEGVGAGVDFDRYNSILQFLDTHWESLESLLTSPQSQKLPHYSFHAGNTITKSVSMSSNLDLLIRDFSAEKGVSQRIIFEAALIQFMQKHGYSKQVDMLLKA